MSNVSAGATRSPGMFFFEKKNQKTFIYSESGRSLSAKKNEQKSLVSFFEKEKPSLAPQIGIKRKILFTSDTLRIPTINELT